MSTIFMAKDVPLAKANVIVPVRHHQYASIHALHVVQTAGTLAGFKVNWYTHPGIFLPAVGLNLVADDTVVYLDQALKTDSAAASRPLLDPLCYTAIDEITVAALAKQAKYFNDSGMPIASSLSTTRDPHDTTYLLIQVTTPASDKKCDILVHTTSRRP